MDGNFLLVLFTATVTGLALVSCHQVCYIGSEYNPKAGIPHRWFLPYEDPCKCTAIRLGGMNIPTSSYRQGAPYYMEHLFLSEEPDEIQTFFNCQVGCLNSEPLGLEDGTIPDDRMTASSYSFGNSHTAADGRLNNQHGSWATDRSENSWIEVDLGDPTVVSGVITQGSLHSSRCVTKYRVAYQQSQSSSYTYVKDNDEKIKVFDGNLNRPRTPVTNLFSRSIEAVKVRLEPVAWDDYVVLRFELLGCRLN